MPITMAKPGETVMIERISGSDEVRQRLSEIGFVIGEQVVVISNISGQMILLVKDARIAIDTKMANRVIVR